MDSSPEPMRRFSRWVTTKRTFVLGGNSYISDNKDHKRNDAKDDNRSTRNDKRTKAQQSPTSPHKEKSHFSTDMQTTESSFINVDFNCKVLIHNLHDPEKTGLVLSDDEQAHNDCIVSKSPQALTVLSPNVTATTKDNQIVISPSKSHYVETDNRDKSHPNGVRETDQLDSETKQDSNPNSVHIDKENSTAVVTAQVDRSSCSGSQTQTSIIPSDSPKSKSTDEPGMGGSLRRESLRDRSLLQSSAILRQKNYPFFTSSKKKKTTEKGSKTVNRHKHLSSQLSTVIHEKGKGKESVEKVTILSEENHRKSSKKNEKEKINATAGDESHLNSQEGKSQSLSSSEIQAAAKSLSERKSESGDCVAQVMSMSQTVSRNNKRKYKDSEIETVVDKKILKSGVKKQKQKDEVQLHTALSISLIQGTSTSEIRKETCTHSNQVVSLSPSGLKSVKRNKRSERQQLTAAKHKFSLSTKRQMRNTNSKSNGDRSVTKSRKKIKTSNETSMHSSGARLNASMTLISSSCRTLRDRSALNTPQMQYPAKFMSAALIKSLSDKAKRLLSIPESKAVSKLSPETERNGSKGNVKNSVTLNDKIPREKTTGKSKASLETSLKHTSQDNLSSKLSQASIALLSSKEKFQPTVNNSKKISTQPSSSPKLNRKPNSIEISENLSLGVSPDELLIPSAPLSSQLELQMEKKRGSKTSKLPSSPQSLKKGDNCKRHAIGKKEFGKDKETSKCADSYIEEMRKKSNSSKKTKASIKNKKPTKALSCEKPSSVHISAERLDGPSEDMEQNSEDSMPTCHEKENIVLNDTAVGSKKNFKRRRLFQDSFSQPKKIRLKRDLYESAGRDILLWSETGEARKSSSVTSLDVLFNDVIELEDHLKDSENEYLQQRVVGKVMSRVKRSLKSQICQLERVRELESQVKMSRERCNKIRADIKEYEDKQRGLDKKLKKRKDSEQKILQEWMKSLKSFMVSSRKL